MVGYGAEARLDPNIHPIGGYTREVLRLVGRDLRVVAYAPADTGAHFVCRHCPRRFSP